MQAVTMWRQLIACQEGQTQYVAGQVQLTLCIGKLIARAVIECGQVVVSLTQS